MGDSRAEPGGEVDATSATAASVGMRSTGSWQGSRLR